MIFFQKKVIFFCPSIEDGGVEKNLYILANYFTTIPGYKIYVITANSDKKNRFNKKVNFLTFNKINFSKSSRLLKSCVAILIFVFYRDFKDSIIFSFQSNIFAIILAKFFNLKVIIRSNTDPSKYSKFILKKKIFRFFFGFANKIIVNSYEFQKNFKRFFNLNSEVIYNPFLIDNAYKKKYKIKEKLNILNIGRLTDQKNQIIILKAINLLKNKIPIKCKIIGKGYKLNELQKYIDKHGLQKNISLVGYKNNIKKYFLESNIFVLSSKYEGLPNVILEAINYENLIVSSNCPSGPKEILLNGQLGFLFPVDNYKKLSKIIFKIYANPKKYNKKIILAKKRLDRFDFKTNLKKYLSLIQSL